MIYLLERHLPRFELLLRTIIPSANNERLVLRLWYGSDVCSAGSSDNARALWCREMLFIVPQTTIPPLHLRNHFLYRSQHFCSLSKRTVLAAIGLIEEKNGTNSYGYKA